MAKVTEINAFRLWIGGSFENIIFWPGLCLEESEVKQQQKGKRGAGFHLFLGFSVKSATINPSISGTSIAPGQNISECMVVTRKKSHHPPEGQLESVENVMELTIVE